MSTADRTRRKNKKLIRVGKNVGNDFGVNLSSEPTKIVLLSNAGLVNGALTSSILETLPGRDSIDYDVVLFPNKTYCVIRCPDVDSATAVVESLDGSTSFDFLNGQRVHAGYLDGDVPNPHIETGPLPPGLKIFENQLSFEDEERWLEICSFADESDCCSLKNRRVEHFGYRFDYAINGVHRDEPLAGKPIPKIFIEFLEKLVAQGLLSESNFPNQLTVNGYEVGAGIPAHCDTHSMFSSCIVVVSLGAAVVMDFASDGREISVSLPRRSVTLMEDESRYAWTHSIAPRKYDLVVRAGGAPLVIRRGVRSSFTFRRVRPQTPCDCLFPSLCDSRLKLALDDRNASHLERLHVHEVYDNIATHFSDTRHTQWPRVVNFLRSLPKWSVVVDVGCGNGKYMRVKSRDDLSFLGCDRSEGLLRICREKSFQALQVDCLALPFREGSFDAVICIAVIHHLSTTSRRKLAIKQMLRSLRNTGKLLISVWARDQNVQGSSKYLKGGRATAARHACVLAGSTEVTLPVHTNGCAFSNSDVLVPWKTAETQETQQRYYHVFEKGELKSLVNEIEGVKVLDEYYDEGNWCLILEKTHRSVK